MKKNITLVLLCFITITGFSQKNISIKGKKIKDGTVYLTFDGTNLSYFSPNDKGDSKKNILDIQNFSLVDDNSCNIYLKWINPLKYNLKWKDTIYVDERDKAIDDFVSLLTSQFGSNVTNLNQNTNKSLVFSNKAVLRSGTELYIPKDGFISPDLTMLYLHLRSNQDNLTETERIQLNAITIKVEDLDKKNAINITESATSLFSQLFALSDPTNVLQQTNDSENEIKRYNVLFSEIEKLQKDITTLLDQVAISDALLQAYTKTTIAAFNTKTSAKLVNDKKLAQKLQPIIDIVKKSIKDESSNIATKGFFKIRDIGFEDGKKIETILTISEFEFKSETSEFLKKSDVIKRTLVFRKYDIIGITFSTGIFYSDTVIKGFGVGDNNGGLIVTEDDLAKNSAVTAVFLNFNFEIGSRYLLPVGQIGVDPTKKRPFLLLGGGFCIPSARLAITGGPLWTWVPTLNKLTLGQSITSTTDLEKDISYKFDVEPKGWYFGIQYNF